MVKTVPPEIDEQVSRAQSLIERHLADTLLALHLYGSAVDGGLKPLSDIDLLATVSIPLHESVRKALLLDLLTVSAPPGADARLRSLELTVVAREEVTPWRYPPRRELQFGEWLRQDILAGIFQLAVYDHDLAILLTKARRHSIALAGPPAAELFEPVPKGDFVKALADSLALWNSPDDWQGDERNVVLTLARIWYSAATGKIAPKDVAAEWALERLPEEHQSVLSAARAAYLDGSDGDLADRAQHTTAFIHYAKTEIRKLLP